MGDIATEDAGSARRTDVVWAVAASIVVQLGFGCYGIVFKPWAGQIDTLIFCVFRDTGGFAVLVVAAGVIEGWSHPPLADAWFFGLLGVFGMFGGQVLYLVAVAWCGPAVASIYQPLIPVFTVVLAILTGMEPVVPCGVSNASRVTGVLLASGGAVVMVTDSFSSNTADNSSDQHDSRMLAGNILLICQCCCTAVYVLLQKKFVYGAPLEDERRIRWSHKPVSLTAWAYFAGALCMWVVAVPYSFVSKENVFSFPLSALIPLSYSVFIGSALCYGLISYANSVLSASITTSFWPLQVLVATTLASYCYDEQMSSLDMFGGFLIISGMLVVTWGNAQSDSGRHRGSYAIVPDDSKSEETGLVGQKIHEVNDGVDERDEATLEGAL